MAFYKNNLFCPADRPVRIRGCDHPNCGQAGEYRAPKNRDRLNEYYFFCLDHVREYNKAWNFFEGLSPDEIESYIRKATVWERPTWPLGQGAGAEKKAKDKIFRDFFGGPEEKMEPPSPTFLSFAEREALSVLELSPPVNFDHIKTRYRTLVKKHHPDLHGNDRKNEERFKEISLAFATLRKVYEENAS